MYFKYINTHKVFQILFKYFFKYFYFLYIVCRILRKINTYINSLFPLGVRYCFFFFLHADASYLFRNCYYNNNYCTNVGYIVHYLGWF